MTDTLTLTAAQFFWIVLGLMVMAAGVTWVAMVGYYRNQATVAIEAARRETESARAELSGVVGIIDMGPAGRFRYLRGPWDTPTDRME